MDNALEIKNLTKNYGDFVLEDISLSLPKGTIMGFIGENGAGKSTTIKCILDVIKKDAGDISVLGNNVPLSSMEKENIGVVLDADNLPDYVTPTELNMIMKNIFNQWDTETYFTYVRKFHLPEKKKVCDFSRGMKMKLAIAIALSHHAKLLILDEATSGLDPIIRDEILDIFLEFIQDEEHAILVSSHITSDLERIADYIAYIRDGKLVFCEPKYSLFEKYVKVQFTDVQFENFDKKRVVGKRKGRYSVDALVTSGNDLQEYVTEKPTIEEIMLYFGKENER